MYSVVSCAKKTQKAEPISEPQLSFLGDNQTAKLDNQTTDSWEGVALMVVVLAPLLLVLGGFSCCARCSVRKQVSIACPHAYLAHRPWAWNHGIHRVD